MIVGSWSRRTSRATMVLRFQRRFGAATDASAATAVCGAAGTAGLAAAGTAGNALGGGPAGTAGLAAALAAGRTARLAAAVRALVSSQPGQRHIGPCGGTAATARSAALFSSLCTLSSMPLPPLQCSNMPNHRFLSTSTSSLTQQMEKLNSKSNNCL